jgi:hypothetical protein
VIHLDSIHVIQCLTSVFVDKMRIELDAAEDDFKKYCERFPAKKLTCRGEPFWNTHCAKDLLADDVKSGLAFELKPELLRETRQEYKDFTLRTFRKHVHQEKEKQRADPYWRHKRNIVGMFKLLKDRGINKDDWIDTRLQVEIDEATCALANI